MALPNCPYLPGNRFGITGTPTLDPATRTLYVADALGYVHGLDPVTLEDKPGWPVRLYRNTAQQLIWGALTLARGKALRRHRGHVPGHGYAPLRDRRADAEVPRRGLPSRCRSAEGAGCGPGGAPPTTRRRSRSWSRPATPSRAARTSARSSASRRATPSTSSNSRRLDGAAGERAAELQDLHGPGPDGRAGRDAFSGCPALVGVQSKNGSVYVWKLGSITKGVWWKKKLAPQLNGNRHGLRDASLYVVGHTRAYRFASAGLQAQPGLVGGALERGSERAAARHRQH